MSYNPLARPLGGALIAPLGAAPRSISVLQQRKVRVKAWGGGGSGGFWFAGGGAGYAGATFWLPAGTSLDVYVGGGGQYQPTQPFQPGGWNGGGAAVGSTHWGHGGPGGGWSGILLQGRPLLIAGGGGGGGGVSDPGYPNNAGSDGGAGGGINGSDAAATGSVAPDRNGRGGTQTAGGTAPAFTSSTVAPTSGSYLQGGQGGAGAIVSTSGFPNQSSGGGGGGYYGGSGGGGNNAINSGGGGGGSGYIDPIYVTDGILTGGSGVIAGNSSDPQRETAGNGGSPYLISGLVDLVRAQGRHGRIVVIIDDVITFVFGFTGVPQPLVL